MSSHVSRMCKAAYHHLYAISKIRRCLTTDACKTLVHALVISRLDYSNAVLYGIKEALINKLQMVQNSAARLIARQRKHQHITPVLIRLHWLPVRWRVQYKLLVSVFTVLHGLAPWYSRDLVTPYSPTHNLRSAGSSVLQPRGLWKASFLGVRTYTLELCLKTCDKQKNILNVTYTRTFFLLIIHIYILTVHM